MSAFFTDKQDSMPTSFQRQQATDKNTTKTIGFNTNKRKNRTGTISA